MYRISSDPRRVRSAGQIMWGVEECLKHKKLADISVTEVCNTAHVGRNTFYRLFDNLIDVFRYYSDNALGMVYTHLKEKGHISIRETCLHSMEELMRRPLLLDALLANDRLDIIYQSHVQYRETVREVLRDRKQLSDSLVDYLLYHMSAMSAAYLRVWYMHGKVESVDEVYDYMKADCGILSEML